MGEMFCNPVPFKDGKKHTNPDPFILRWCGKYYCYATDEAGVKVSVSEDMVHWDFRGYAIAEKEYHHYWAPSVVYINGEFYMYYSNIPAEEEDCHEQHLKLAVSEDPLGTFVYSKTFFDKFSIDSHPVVWNGELYMFYSVNDWIGLEPKVAGTCILVDRMLTPEEFSGEPKAVVLPSLPQEIYEKNRFGDGRDWYTIEGASPVFHGDKCWMLYSANAFESIDYFVGTAVAETKEDLREMVWKKYPNEYTWMPLLKKNRAVEGTGHNTTAKAPNLFEDWIVYHGRDIEEGLHQGMEQRNMRIDPLLYFGNRMFCPGPSCQKRPAPGKGRFSKRETRIEENIFLTEAKDFYRMEIWCSAEPSHAGAKYRIYPDHTDEKNYIGLEMHSGRGKAVAIRCSGGIAEDICSMDLPKGYDFGVPHLISVERKSNHFKVTLDEDKSMEFSADTVSENGMIGAGGCFTPVTLHSVTVSEGVELRGKELIFLSSFYECSGAEIRDGMLRSVRDGLYLTEKCAENAGNTGRGGITAAESFQWQVLGGDNRVNLFLGEEKLCSLAGIKDTVTFYCYRRNGRSYILTDGKTTNTEITEMTNVSERSGISEEAKEWGITILSAEDRKNVPLKLEVKGLGLREYMRIL